MATTICKEDELKACVVAAAGRVGTGPARPGWPYRHGDQKRSNYTLGGRYKAHSLLPSGSRR